MNAATAEIALRQPVYDRLMDARMGDPVEDILARILSSWVQGIGAMPYGIGLGKQGFEDMLHRHFPNFDKTDLPAAGDCMDADRGDEMADLHKLLMQSRTHATDTQAMMVDILVAGCMGDDHLWRDLGLWSRADLSRLMTENFAPLAARNDRDMKWKKFLYKQLCETEGIYTCRAPSCEVCTDFAVCFGPED